MSRRSSALAVWGVLMGFAVVGTDAARAGEVPFGEHTVDGTFDGAVLVYAADVDGDGDTDLLGAAFDADEITWWENLGGDGTAWTAHTVDGAFDGAVSVYATDVDGDGDIDVLGAASIADEITWWENLGGDGTSWIEHTVGSAFDGAVAVYAADVDGDGDIDVLGAARTDDEIIWWENLDGDGTSWDEHRVDSAFDGARSVYATDVDGDGDIDVLGAARTDDDITWWENLDGDGTTWTEHTIDGTFDFAFSIYATDVDGDGDTDVLGAAVQANIITWWENQGGDGTLWTEHTIDDAFNGASSVYATDVDGDGDTDVLGAAVQADAITWWENIGGSGAAWTEHTVDGAFDGARSVYATDVDGDGDIDVLGMAVDADDLTWWENETIHESAVHPEKLTIDGGFDGASSVYATDVDGDGDTDVLGAAIDAGAISWWENIGGNGTSWTEHTVDGAFDGARSVHATDVDGDGDIDILGAAFDADEISWWENVGGDGTSWDKHTVDSTFDGAVSVYTADVDGDGDIDVLGAARLTDEISWWENLDGDGTSWDKHTVDSALDGVRWVYATDVDGDGDIDVLGAALDADEITWWENIGGNGAAWTAHTVDGGFDGASSVYATDVDGDGDTDVLGAAILADEIIWWENLGGDGTAWTEHTIDGAFDGAFSVYATDVDGDGDIDVLGAARFADDITWWENIGGNGTSWTEHTVDGAIDGARSIYATDVDGDGDIDILGAAEATDEITWWENQGGQFALPTLDMAPARVDDGATAAALAIDAAHRGRAGDSDAELVTLELLLTDLQATPFTSSQADDLFVALSVYLDEGSGAFEPGVDSEVTFVTSFPLTAGVLTVPFADDDPEAQFAVSSPEKYFVVVEFESDASQQIPDQVIVTHLTEASSTGEDAAHDLPIGLEFATNVASGLIEVNDLPVAQPDEFMIVKNTDLFGNVLEDNGLGPDSDEENDPLTTTLVTPPTQGTLLGGLGTDGAFTYQPDPDTTGVDTFAYLANDGFGDSNIATVTVVVDSQLIFSDGFESGDTFAWSATVP